METRYLETLITAVECGSFSRAAEVLHVTQSAVSQRIKFLEESFGQQLLDRSGPRLRETPAGRLALERAREILAIERSLFEQLRRFGGEKRLSICCTPTFGMAFLPLVLNDFMRRNADLDDFKFIFQQPEQAWRGLQENLYDLAIIEHCDDLDFAPLPTTTLLRDELVFVSSPRLGLSGGELPLAALFPHRIYARRDGCSSKELLKRGLASFQTTLDNFAGIVISDDLRLTLQEVASGHGISFVSLALAAELVASGELTVHRVPGFRHDRCRSLVVSQEHGQDSIVSDFVHSVLATLDKGSCTTASDLPATCHPRKNQLTSPHPE